MQNIAAVLLFLIFLVIAGLVLIPVLTIGVFLLVSAGVVLLWLLPILIIAASDRTTGGEKVAWILAIVFLSWFAWIFYFLLAPLKPKQRDRYYY